LDVLVNNAGVMLLSHVDKLKVDEWERMVDINIKGVMFCTASAMPHLIASGSNADNTTTTGAYIINVSSDADRKIFVGSSVYSATKAFVSLFSEGLRSELASKNVRVTSISCGAVSTELASHISDKDVLDTFASFPPMTFLSPDDIANSIVWCLNQPAHVDVNNLFVRPTMQTQ
jgi:NADP-dependent 3-hydroxy acid dehydrogenase YdfG